MAKLILILVTMFELPLSAGCWALGSAFHVNFDAQVGEAHAVPDRDTEARRDVPTPAWTPIRL